jgi:hypothetical protein
MVSPRALNQKASSSTTDSPTTPGNRGDRESDLGFAGGGPHGRARELAQALLEAVREERPSWSGPRAIGLRATRGMIHLLESLKEEDVLEALGEEDDVDVIVHLLERYEGRSESRTLSVPTIEERMRALEAKKRILEECGGTYTVSEVSELLDIQPESVRARIRRGTLLAVRLGGSDLLIPSCQFEGAQTVSGLAEALKALRGEGTDREWTILSVLIEPLEALRDESGPRSILQALSAGEKDKALSAATFIHETGGV